MNLAIDATNIRSGGGITHLKEILKVKPKKFKKIYIWSSIKTLSYIEDKKWIKKKTNFFINHSFVASFLWQYLFLDHKLKKMNCNILFVPGGVYLGNFKFVTMCRNMLPFDNNERNRYRYSKKFFKLLLLKFFQLKTFKRSLSTIFLNKFAQKKIFLIQKKKNFSIIPHGINKKKFTTKKKFNFKNPHLVYVSNFEKYKNFDTVIKAFDCLAEKNKELKLTLAGNGEYKMLDETLKNIKNRAKITIYNKVAYDQIQKIYNKADIFIFASSCENFPNIFLEAMSTGLPICCANKEPMRSIAGNSVIYFNERNHKSLENQVKYLIKNKNEIKKKIKKYQLILNKYSWIKTANNTFSKLEALSK
jgi:glycosyltransferase involved in cell wall biosynthesis